MRGSTVEAEARSRELPRETVPREAREARGLDWQTLLLLCAMWALLVGNFALYRAAPLPLLLHVLVSAVAIHLAFTIWHEAAHRNVSRRLWVNHAIGLIGMFPYMTPFFMQKWIHLQHHARLNEPDDPNAIYAGGSFLTLPLRYLPALRYAREVLRHDPRPRAERVADACFLVTLASVWAAALWLGVFQDLLLLWFLPLVLAKGVMDWYINWLPHVGLPADRFLGTRVVDVGWLTPLILGHNYHAIHHLWPRIPWHRYHAVFEDQLDYLRQHGVPIETSVFSGSSRRPRVAA
jgi:beta-carotene hydroxylase